MNRPNILFSRTESDPNRDHPRWDNVRMRATAHRLIVEGRIQGEPIVTPILKFTDDLPVQYERIVGDPKTSVKMGIEY